MIQGLPLELKELTQAHRKGGYHGRKSVTKQNPQVADIGTAAGGNWSRESEAKRRGQKRYGEKGHWSSKDRQFYCEM